MFIFRGLTQSNNYIASTGPCSKLCDQVVLRRFSKPVIVPFCNRYFETVTPSHAERPRTQKYDTRAPKSYKVSKQRTSYNQTSAGSRQYKQQKQDSLVTRNRKGPGTSTTLESDEAEPETWRTQKDALSRKFGSQGWQPRKRLSPDAMEGIRSLHAQDPERYSTSILSQEFEISPEAIRRILKSKWNPNEDEDEDRRRRWHRRGQDVWDKMSQLGMKPPKRWRGTGQKQVSAAFERDAHQANDRSSISDSSQTPLADKFL